MNTFFAICAALCLAVACAQTTQSEADQLNDAISGAIRQAALAMGQINKETGIKMAILSAKLSVERAALRDQAGSDDSLCNVEANANLNLVNLGQISMCKPTALDRRSLALIMKEIASAKIVLSTGGSLADAEAQVDLSVESLNATIEDITSRVDACLDSTAERLRDQLAAVKASLGECGSA